MLTGPLVTLTTSRSLFLRYTPLSLCQKGKRFGESHTVRPHNCPPTQPSFCSPYSRIVSAYSSTVAFLWKPLFWSSNNYGVIGYYSPSWFSLSVFETDLLLGPISRSAVVSSPRIGDSNCTACQTKTTTSKNIDIPDIEIMLVSPRALYPDLHPMHSDDLCLQRGAIRPAPKRVQLSECGPMLRKQRHCSTLVICSPRPPKDPNRPANSPLLLTALIKKCIQALDYPIGEWIQWVLVPDGDDGTSAAWSPKNTERRTATSRRRIVPGPEDSCNPNGGGLADEQLEVYGVVGLRATDSSIFPRVLASASCSVAEKYTVLP